MYTNKEMLKEQHYGGNSFSAKSAQMSVLMKCLSADAHSMGNRQEELEVYMQLHNCSLRITKLGGIAHTTQLSQGITGYYSQECDGTMGTSQDTGKFTEHKESTLLV